MKSCFVIQRFDGATYDRRYRETFAPSIEAAGAKPIRADEVLGTRPVVSKIEQGIISADVVFAEVSEDNPNVFLELGYALSMGVPCVIVCDKAKRTTLPFDIAHRPVNFYETESQSDWEKIAQEVTKQISVALLEKRVDTSFETKLENSNDKDSDEIRRACMLELLDQTMRNPNGASLWDLQKELASSSISSRMVALALASLHDGGLIEKHEQEGEYNEIYNSYSLSETGQKYVLRDYSALMREEKARAAPSSADARNTSAKSSNYDDLDDEVPF